MAHNDDKIENLNSKTLREFRKGDTLYIKQLKGGMDYTFYCRFVELKRGIVQAEIINICERDYLSHKYPEGTPITSRANKCFLWGQSNLGWPSCHWFKNLDTPAV